MDAEVAAAKKRMQASTGKSNGYRTYLSASSELGRTVLINFSEIYSNASAEAAWKHFICGRDCQITAGAPKSPLLCPAG